MEISYLPMLYSKFLLDLLFDFNVYSGFILFCNIFLIICFYLKALAIILPTYEHFPLDLWLTMNRKNCSQWKIVNIISNLQLIHY